MVSIWNWFPLILDFYVLNYFGKNFEWRSGLHQAPLQQNSDMKSNLFQHFDLSLFEFKGCVDKVVFLPTRASLLEKFGTHSFKFLRQLDVERLLRTHKRCPTPIKTGETHWDKICTEVVFACKYHAPQQLILNINFYVWNTKCRY